MINRTQAPLTKVYTPPVDYPLVGDTVAEPIDIKVAGDRRTAKYSDRRDMANEDIRALIGAERAARERDQKVYDEQITGLKSSFDKLDAKLNKVVVRVVGVMGGITVLVFLANWIGPTVIRRAIDALIGVP